MLRHASIEVLLPVRLEKSTMANPLVIDCHMHVYRTQQQAIWGKENYEIWEYGEKANVHSCESAGDTSDALEALDTA